MARFRGTNKSGDFIELHDFICPFTMEVMKDPVIAADGHSYEREIIIKWLRHKSTSPTTRQKIKHKKLKSNEKLKEAIQNYHEQVKWLKCQQAECDAIRLAVRLGWTEEGNLKSQIRK